MSKLTCAITMGDPAGIGPEVVIKALMSKEIQRLANFLIIGNFFAFKKTARISKIGLKINRIKNVNQFGPQNDNGITLLDVGNISKLVFGRGITAYGLVALQCIKIALKLIKSKKIDALITAPVNKHTMRKAKIPFKGHTEYLAGATKTKNFAMMLIGGQLKVVLVTRHLAIKKVSAGLTKEKICQALRLTAFALKKYFGIQKPRIGVCGLNPHSGDKGILGWEEIKTIRPAVIKAQNLAYIAGPLPADTLFYSALQGEFDAVVCMYHDQGLIPIKTHAFHQGVNLTLGLPFVRTCPAHGTAYDIAGKNIANPGSMIEAIKLAVKICSRLKKV